MEGTWRPILRSRSVRWVDAATKCPVRALRGTRARLRSLRRWSGRHRLPAARLMQAPHIRTAGLTVHFALLRNDEVRPLRHYRRRQGPRAPRAAQGPRDALGRASLRLTHD